MPADGWQQKRVLRALDREGMIENTTFIFSADHGDEMGDHGLEMRGPFATSGSLQIPLIVAGHPSVGKGLVTDALAGNIDLAATVLDVAGDDRPLGHSRSLINLAQAEPQHPREAMVSEYMDHMKVVESAAHRFVYYPFLDCTELFAIESDPHCLSNLAGMPEHAGIELAMQRVLLDHAALCRGPRFIASDLAQEVQTGLERADPNYRENIPVAFPLSKGQRTLLQSRGLDANYNEFCRSREIIAHYGTYWERSKAMPGRPMSAVATLPGTPPRKSVPRSPQASV